MAATGLLALDKKLIPLRPPNFQTHVFRMKWQLLSVSTARALDRRATVVIPNKQLPGISSCANCRAADGSGFAIRNQHSQSKETNSPEMNTCRKRGEGYPPLWTG